MVTAGGPLPLSEPWQQLLLSALGMKAIAARAVWDAITAALPK